MTQYRRDGLVDVEPRLATAEELALNHDPEHVARVASTRRPRRARLRCRHAGLRRESFATAALAAGGYLAAARGDPRRRRRQRLRVRAAAGAPRRGRPRHGLLSLQQRRDRRRAGCGTPRRRPHPDRRLGRAPRQRHAGQLLRRSRRRSTSRRTSIRSIRAPAPRARSAAAPPPGARSTCRCRPAAATTSTSRRSPT